MDARKPPPVAMERRSESRTEYIGLKVTPTEKAELVAASGGPGELSRYACDCMFIGHSVKQAQSAIKGGPDG